MAGYPGEGGHRGVLGVKLLRQFSAAPQLAEAEGPVTMEVRAMGLAPGAYRQLCRSLKLGPEGAPTKSASRTTKL